MQNIHLIMNIAKLIPKLMKHQKLLDQILKLVVLLILNKILLFWPKDPNIMLIGVRMLLLEEIYWYFVMIKHTFNIMMYRFYLLQLAIFVVRKMIM